MVQETSANLTVDSYRDHVGATAVCALSCATHFTFQRALDALAIKKMPSKIKKSKHSANANSVNLTP